MEKEEDKRDELTPQEESMSQELQTPQEKPTVEDPVSPQEEVAPQEEPIAMPPKYEAEKMWAEKLGMNFDCEEVEASQQEMAEQEAAESAQQASVSVTPPPYPGTATGYYMPQGMPQEQAPEPMPPTYTIWAILATICCCLPAGIIALVFSASVSTKYYARDYEGARKASERTEMWIIASIVLGVISNILYLPLTMLTSL